MIEKINKTQQKREYNDSLARPKLITEGFDIQKEKENEYGDICSVLYTIDFFEIEHILKTNTFMLRDITKGSFSKYKGINAVIEAYNRKKANNSGIIKRENRWNKESKERLQAQAKHLKELIHDGLSLSKACKIVKLDYKMGKLLIQEKFLDKL